MKKQVIIPTIVVLFGLLGSVDGYSRSNYVVIGAFRNETNAIHFTESARQHHLDASYSLNKVRLLFYVYVMHSDDAHKAVEEVLRLRAHTEYTGAWVYHGVLGDDQVHDGIEIKAPVHSEVIASVSIPPPAESKAANPAETPTTKEEVRTAETVQPGPAPAPVVEVKIPESGDATSPAATSKLFYFKIYTADAVPHEGTVELLDVDRQRKAGTFKGNEPVAIKSINASGDMRFDCQVAGYRKVTQTINFKKPATNEAGISIENNQIIVPFELVPLQKGDISILYNVYFYKDAAIMRPESKYELDRILVMMNDNPRYRIKFHGHTNGNASGKIIEMGDGRNFFSLTGSKEGFGSAKKLAEARAIAIREYMISEGVAADRMEVKAWGGKKPIYKKDHAQAGQNVRVEIEVLDD